MTLSLTYMQRVRLSLIMRDHTGTRKDPATRTILDLEERIGISDADLAEVVRPVGDKNFILAADEIEKRPAADFELSRAEAAVLLEKLNSLTLTPADIRGWADPLAKALDS